MANPILMSKFDVPNDELHTAETVIFEIEKHLSSAENRKVSHKMGKAEMEFPYTLKTEIMVFVKEFLSMTNIHITWEPKMGQGCLGKTKIQIHWTAM
jgi:hypothetical protein